MHSYTNIQGSVKGVRYFACKPRHGLFARAETVEQVQTNTTAQVRASPAATAARSPSVASRTGSFQQQQQAAPQQAQPQVQAFQIAASAFCFRKDINQWSELGTGQIRLYKGADYKVHLDSGAGAQSSLNHTVDVGTKLEPNIGSDRAWVFRATNIATYNGDVIALQFSDPMSAQRFSDTFEDLLSGSPLPLAAASINQVGAPPAPQAAAPAAPAPAPAQPNGAPIRQQRRRLSVVSDSVNADGRRSSVQGRLSFQSW
jgi:hypothetical protein